MASAIASAKVSQSKQDGGIKAENYKAEDSSLQSAMKILLEKVSTSGDDLEGEQVRNATHTFIKTILPNLAASQLNVLRERSVRTAIQAIGGTFPVPRNEIASRLFDYELDPDKNSLLNLIRLSKGVVPLLGLLDDKPTLNEIESRAIAKAGFSFTISSSSSSEAANEKFGVTNIQRIQQIQQKDFLAACQNAFSCKYSGVAIPTAKGVSYFMKRYNIITKI